MSKQDAVAMVKGESARERVLWKAKSEADAAWVYVNEQLWAAILTAMRDHGAWIGCAFDGEEGMVEATLYLDGRELCQARDVEDYHEWLAYRSDKGGYCEYRWDAEKSPKLLADLMPEDDAELAADPEAKT